MTSITSASRWSRARVVVLLVGLVLALLQAPARAQQVDPLREAQVKAGYLINFLRYTEFPVRPGEPPDRPYRIAVIDDELLYSVLQAAAADVTVNARPLSVRQGLPASDDAAGETDLIYLGQPASSAARARVRELSGTPVLTVGEDEDFVAGGGMLGLSLEGTRIVFDANLLALRTAGLSMSAKALKLARRLHPEDGQ